MLTSSGAILSRCECDIIDNTSALGNNNFSYSHCMKYKLYNMITYKVRIDNTKLTLDEYSELLANGFKPTVSLIEQLIRLNKIPELQLFKQYNHKLFKRISKDTVSIALSNNLVDCYESVKLVLESGFDIKKIFSMDMIKIIQGFCFINNKKMVQLLIRHGVPKSYFNPGIEILVSNGHVELLNMLVDYGIQITDKELVWKALLKNNIKMVKYLLGKGLIPNKSDGQKYILDACRSNDHETLKRLLFAGVIPNESHIDYAAIRNRKECSALLIEHGTPVNASTVITAYFNGNLELVKLLMPNVKNKECIPQSILNKINN